MKPNFLLLLLILHLIACESKLKESQSSKDSLNLDTIIFNKDSIKIKQITFIAKEIRLDSICNGSDSFELRLWVQSAIIPNHLIIIKRTQTDYENLFFDYYVEADGRIMYKPKKLKEDLTLLDSLKTIDFESLLSQYQISGFNDNVADGVTYTLEVAKKGRYKVISYHCPETFASSEIHNKRFFHIIQILNKHFKFYSPYCKT